MLVVATINSVSVELDANANLAVLAVNGKAVTEAEPKEELIRKLYRLINVLESVETS